MKLTKANALTLWRFATAPLFLAVWFAAASRAGLAACLALAVLSELSDALDGYFARRDRTVSSFGKLMDPYADSVFRLTVFFSFAGAGWIPVWMPVVLFYRDALTSIVRVFGMRRGVVVAARFSGKLKAITQGIVMITALSSAQLFWSGEYLGLVLTKDFVEVVSNMTWVVVAVAVVSGLDYLWSNRAAFSEEGGEQPGGAG